MHEPFHLKYLNHNSRNEWFFQPCIWGNIQTFQVTSGIVDPVFQQHPIWLYTNSLPREQRYNLFHSSFFLIPNMIIIRILRNLATSQENFRNCFQNTDVTIHLPKLQCVAHWKIVFVWIFTWYGPKTQSFRPNVFLKPCFFRLFWYWKVQRLNWMFQSPEGDLYFTNVQHL